MNVLALVTGKLHGAPVASTSRNGRPYTRATLAIQEGTERRFVTMFAFGDTVQAELAQLSDGESLSVQGPMKAEIYQPNDGSGRVSFSIAADHVLPLRAPPKERGAAKKKSDTPPPTQRARSEKVAPAPDRNGFATHGDGGVDHFNDEIPF